MTQRWWLLRIIEGHRHLFFRSRQIPSDGHIDIDAAFAEVLGDDHCTVGYDDETAWHALFSPAPWIGREAEQPQQRDTDAGTEDVLPADQASPPSSATHQESVRSERDAGSEATADAAQGRSHMQPPRGDSIGQTAGDAGPATRDAVQNRLDSTAQEDQANHAGAADGHKHGKSERADAEQSREVK